MTQLGGKVRTYYVAAQDVVWDFAPDTSCCSQYPGFAGVPFLVRSGVGGAGVTAGPVGPGREACRTNFHASISICFCVCVSFVRPSVAHRPRPSPRARPARARRARR